jgi:hypothetical protein
LFKTLHFVCRVDEEFFGALHGRSAADVQQPHWFSSILATFTLNINTDLFQSATFLSAEE